MEDLTFGEQVKIILGRKGMTIKELAEIIEERTGKKMSRQNLTQRLGRDNFQEQDMRTIANILGCPFHLSILSRESSALAITVTASGESVPTEKELQKVEQKRQQKNAERELAFSAVQNQQETEDMLDEDDAEDIEDIIPDSAMAGEAETGTDAAEEASAVRRQDGNPENVAEVPAGDGNETEEVDMTIGELYEFHDELSELEENVQAGEPIETIKEELDQKAEVKKEKKDKFRTGAIFLRKKGTPPPVEEIKPQRDEKRAAPDVSEEEPDDFEPVIKHDDVEEDRVLGEVNPYTGREFQSNSVRMHPNRIGYVQVYDRSTHKWTDMTEWAFLGYQERKKALLGKEYEPPIYLD